MGTSVLGMSRSSLVLGALSCAYFQIQIKRFLDTFIQFTYFFFIERNEFLGDLTDVEAETKNTYLNIPQTLQHTVGGFVFADASVRSPQNSWITLMEDIIYRTKVHQIQFILLLKQNQCTLHTA